MSKKKGKAKKIILKILATILCISVAIAIVTAIVNTIVVKANVELAQSFETVKYENQLIPEKDNDGVWTFTTDNDFKVMQLTDIHIGGGWMSAKKDPMALNAVASMITAEKPDLVIITGDMVYPVPFQAGTFNNLSGAKIIANLFESLGVYWLPVFGNHDTEAYAYYNRDKIAKFYASDNFKYCLLDIKNITDDIDGACNSVINVKNSDGFITQSFYSLDSHSYIDGDFLGLFWKYDGVHENQIAWYKQNVEKYNQQNLDLINQKYVDQKQAMTEKYGTVKSLAFFHIPTSEYLTAWNEYVAAGYKDTDNVIYNYGTVGETGQLVYHSIHEDMLFETMQELGSTKGIFCGHDHLNNFSIDYKGIRLTYGYSVDYLAYSGIYKLGSQRGCTMITVKPDGSFDCTPENYYQDKYVNPDKEEVTMQDLNAIES